MDSSESDLAGVDELLREGSQEIIENKEMFEKESKGVSAGFEQEYIIYTSEGELDDGKLQQRLKSEIDRADSEVGQAMIEFDIGPMRIEEWNRAEEAIIQMERAANKVLGPDGFLVRHGSIPNVSLPELEITSGEEAPDRYMDLVTDFESRRETEKFGNGIPLSARIVCGIAGTQINCQAENLEEGVEKHNYLYQIGRSVAAVSGNSPIMGGELTGLENTRIPGWMAAFNSTEEEDERQKVGPISEYHEEILDLIENRDLDHREAENPFQAAQGEDWKYVRGKLEKPGEDEDEENPTNYQFIIEGRVPGMQETAAEDVALAAFQVGWTHYAQKNDEDLVSIESINEDYREAFADGLDAELTELNEEDEEIRKPAEEVISKEISEAREGLEDLGAEKYADYLNILEQRLENGETPADKYRERVEAYSKQHGHEDSLVLALPKAGTRYKGPD